MSSIPFASLPLCPRPKVHRIVLAVVLGVLVLVLVPGVGPLALDAAPSAAAEEKERTFDFGVQVVGGEVRHTFFIVNSGKEALTVGKITTDCSCTKVVSQPKSVASGERGELVVMTKPEKAGVSNITIIVETKTGSATPATAAGTKPAAPTAPTAFAVFRLTGVVMAKPGDVKPTDTKPADTKPADTKTPAAAANAAPSASSVAPAAVPATNAATAPGSAAPAASAPAAVVPTLTEADLAALYIPAKEVLEAAAKAAAKAPGSSLDTVLVDLRTPELFGKARIKGSVNMTPLGLMARHDYKDKALVVVIDDGMGTSALPARLQRLKTAGWKNVRLLQGGLRSWQLAGGTLEGTASQGAALAMTTPAAFYERQHADEVWLVITTGTLTFPTRFPVVAVTEPVGSPAFAARVQQELKRRPETKRVLVADADGKSTGFGTGFGPGSGPDQLEAALRPLGLPLYYIEGGASAFTTFSQQQTRLLQARQVTLGNQASTHTSEQTRGPVVRGAGCGTCSK